jgi:hypothetical protein
MQQTKITSELLQLDLFKEASPELLAQRRLLQRIDTKFILSLKHCRELFSLLQKEYAIVRSEGSPIACYKNLYFDTKEHDFLKAHHRGQRPRYKVRIRHYQERKLSFLEVKKKNSADHTIKQRLELPYQEENLADHASFLKEHSPAPASRLYPSLRTDFQRITLVGQQAHERITFDTHLYFSSPTAHQLWPYGVIAEVKQGRYAPRSPVMLALRSLKALPLSVSKYCTAALLLLPHLKMNLYRPKLRQLRKSFHD